MHILVCICSNVRQFHEIIGMIQMCYHTTHFARWPCFVNTRVFICYKTKKGTLMMLSFTRVTLRVLALLGQVTWTGTVYFRGGPLVGGHEATDIGLAYAPVSQAHGHHHTVPCFALLHCSAEQFCTTPGGC